MSLYSERKVNVASRPLFSLGMKWEEAEILFLVHIVQMTSIFSPSGPFFVFEWIDGASV